MLVFVKRKTVASSGTHWNVSDEVLQKMAFGCLPLFMELDNYIVHLYCEVIYTKYSVDFNTDPDL